VDERWKTWIKLLGYCQITWKQPAEKLNSGRSFLHTVLDSFRPTSCLSSRGGFVSKAGEPWCAPMRKQFMGLFMKWVHQFFHYKSSSLKYEFTGQYSGQNCGTMQY